MLAVHDPGGLAGAQEGEMRVESTENGVVYVSGLSLPPSEQAWERVLNGLLAGGGNARLRRRWRRLIHRLMLAEYERHTAALVLL